MQPFNPAGGRIVQQKVQAEAGNAPLRDANGALQRNTDGSLVIGPVTDRWVGTGRTICNNKGNPIKQFEPFFSEPRNSQPNTQAPRPRHISIPLVVFS